MCSCGNGSPNGEVWGKIAARSVRATSQSQLSRTKCLFVSSQWIITETWNCMLLLMCHANWFWIVHCWTLPSLWRNRKTWSAFTRIALTTYMPGTNYLRVEAGIRGSVLVWLSSVPSNALLGWKEYYCDSSKVALRSSVTASDWKKRPADSNRWFV